MKQLSIHQKNTINAPLAERMRPQELDDILGQDEVIGPNSTLGRILRDKTAAIPSMILVGPPGIGKTTIAHVIAKTSDYRFVRLSGVLDGVKELKEAVIEAKRSQDLEGRPTLALVDEIHRFNKSQQDAFLPHVESGLLTVIGQTTENVSFRIRNALLSRMRVVELTLLDRESMETLVSKALKDTEHGLGAMKLEIEPQAVEYICRFAMGDARRLLNGLEWSALNAQKSKVQCITASIVEESYGTQPPNFDHDGDYHYDCISAFIKSMRGSDPDAALYYMLRALAGGEDPLFLTRRMIIFASEDACCDPRALEIALNVDRAVERVGLPEAKIPMAHGVVYLSCCQKSNSAYVAMKAMDKVVAENFELEIPRHLRNAPTDLMRDMGNSVGYRYPHDHQDAFVPERYMPEKLKDLRVYEPTDRGLDVKIKERLTEYERRIRAARSK